MISIRKRLGSAMVCVLLLSASALPAAAQTLDARLDANILPVASLSHSDSGARVGSFGDLSVGNFSFNAPASYRDGLLRFGSSPTTPVPRYPLSVAGDWTHAALDGAHRSVSEGGSLSHGHERDVDGNDSFVALQARQDGSADSAAVNPNLYEVSAVSEPSSFALAAAGLAIIGFVAAKRRRS